MSDDADQAASQLLDLLGRRHAKTGSKSAPFQKKFNVLECSLDLTDLPKESVVLENKPGRMDRLVQLLTDINKAGVLSKHQAQVVHGLMRYATGFFSGKYLHQVCAEVMAISSSVASRSSADVRSFCSYAIRMLQSAEPRRLDSGYDKRPILVFSDGCWESGRAGIGAVVIDLASGSKMVCSGEVPEGLLAHWKRSVGDFIICQIELYVMVLLRWQFGKDFHNRRSIWWVDNDAARYAAIKGLSPSLTMRILAREFYAMDSKYQTSSWIERVPSKWNMSDGPSRGQPDEALLLLDTESVTQFDHPEELLNRLVAGL